MGIKKVVKGVLKNIRKREIVPISYPVSCNEEFDEKVALISGGSGGIGLEIAKMLLENKCKVVVGGTNKQKLEKIKREISNPNLSVIEFDYSDIDSFENIVNDAVSIYGPINIFISSVGVHTENVDLWTVTSEEYDRVMDINLKGTYFACRAVGRYMKEHSIQGSILLVSSSRGSEPAWSPYGISKWGIHGFTKGLAKMLLPYGITVNAIAPGSTATALLGVKEGDSIYTEENIRKRYVMPNEVAILAKLLVSDAGAMISGETVHISAGRGTFDIR